MGLFHEIAAGDRIAVACDCTMEKMYRLVVLIGLCLCMIAMESPAQKKAPSWQVTLSLDPATPPQVGGQVLLSFTVKNTGTKPQKFCRFMTPFEGFNGNLLHVTDPAGARVGYTGVLKKRGKPGPGDYFRLDGGESQTVRFDLLPAYPLTAAGVYHVRFLGSQAINGLPDSNVLEVVVAAP